MERNFKNAALGMSLIAALIYLAFPNRNFSNDALIYAAAAESGDWNQLLHPHHLLYNVCGYLVWKGLGMAGISFRAVYLLQTINSLIGAAGLYVLFFSFRNILRWNEKANNNFRVCAGSQCFPLLIAFSAGYWFYSIESEVYIPALFFIICAFYLITKGLLQDYLERQNIIRIGVLISLACLFHQTHIFFIPAALIAVYRLRKNLSFRRGALLLLFPIGAIILPAYLLAAAYTGHLQSLARFFYWITLYSHAGVYGHFKILNTAACGMGILRTWALSSVLKMFIVNRIVTLRIILLLMGMLIFLMCLFVNLFELMKRFPRYMKIFRVLITLYIAWIIPYALFNFWWEPYNQEFWIPVLIPMVGLFSIPCLARPSFHRVCVTWPAIILLFLINLTGEMIPQSNLKNNERYQLCLELNRHGIKEQDRIIMPNDTPLAYYNYFWGVKLPSLSFYLLEDRAEADIAKEIAEAKKRGGRLLISEAEINPVGVRALLRPARLPKETIRKFYDERLPRRKPLFTYLYDGRNITMFECSFEAAQ